MNNHVTHHGRTRPVAFAGLLGRYPTPALRRAAELARLRDAVLDVVQATSAIARHHVQPPEVALDDALEKTRQLRRARAWCRRVLHGVPYRLDVIDAPFESAVAAYARRADPDLVVVAPYEGSGRRAATLAQRIHTPVMVARPHRRSRAAVVATDLVDPAHPVLHGADELLPDADTVIAVHAFDGGATIPLRRQVALAKRARLDAATASLAHRAEGVLGLGNEVARRAGTSVVLMPIAPNHPAR